jgi:hypothetical protein
METAAPKNLLHMVEIPFARMVCAVSVKISFALL